MAESKKAETKVEATTAESKPVTPREDPIARAQRLLEETIEKTKAKAAKELAKAREDLAASQRNVDKAVKVRDERKARVEALEAQASASMTHGSNSYAVALGAESVDPVED